MGDCQTGEVDGPRRVDLNADLGEAYGVWDLGRDEELLAVVTTAHVACGFHAGDPAVMRRTVAAAGAAGVVVGAHPSYPDMVGFGRRDMEVPPSRVADDVLYQVGALDGLARACGTRVGSVKLHGALYRRAAVDEACALAVAEAVAAYDERLVLVTLAGSPTLDAVRATGVPVVAEGFCDRGYYPDGRLADRGDDGWVVIDPEQAAERACSMVLDHLVAAVDGSELWVEVDTLCVHSDTPGSAAIARWVRDALEAAGVTVASYGWPDGRSPAA